MDRNDEGVDEKEPELDVEVAEDAAVAVEDGRTAEERRRDTYRLW